MHRGPGRVGDTETTTMLSREWRPARPEPDALAQLGLYDPSSATPPSGWHYPLPASPSAGPSTRSRRRGATSVTSPSTSRCDPIGRRRSARWSPAAGLEWEAAERLVTAIGLPADPDEPVTAGEAATARLLIAVSRDLLGEAATVQFARVAGNAMARIAETIVTTFRLNVELPRLSRGTSRLEVVKRVHRHGGDAAAGVRVHLRRSPPAPDRRPWRGACGRPTRSSRR